MALPKSGQALHEASATIPEDRGKAEVPFRQLEEKEHFSVRRCSDILARNSPARLSAHGAFEIMMAAAAVPGKGIVSSWKMPSMQAFSMVWWNPWRLDLMVEASWKQMCTAFFLGFLAKLVSPMPKNSATALRR